MAFRYAVPVALACVASPAFAGSVADLGLSLEQIRDLNAQLTAPIAAPGIAFGSPTAFGASWGQAYAGLGGQTVTDQEEDLDGSATVGVGIGDPRRGIGLETAVNVISLQEGFGDDGSWAFKLHKVLSNRSAIAAGVDNTAGWGGATQQNSSAYVSYSRVIDLAPETPKRPLGLAFSIGAGKERFAEPGDDFGVFGSVALALHRQASVIVDYSRGDFGVAVSVVPFYRIPLVATAGVINVSERYADLEFAAGVGYLYSF